MSHPLVTELPGNQSTNSFTRDDLPLVGELVTSAWRDILKREATAAAEKG